MLLRCFVYRRTNIVCIRRVSVGTDAHVQRSAHTSQYCNTTHTWSFCARAWLKTYEATPTPVFNRNFTLISVAICLSPRMTSPSTSDFHFHFFLNTHCGIRSAPYRPYRWFTRILKVMSPTRSLKRASLRTTSISGSTRISATTRWIWRSKTSSQRICWLHHWRTGARSKCRLTTTSLSLAQRKLGDRLVQSSIQHGETFCFGGTVNQRKMPPRFMKKRVSSFSQRCTLKYWSNIAKLRRLKQTFVNFNDKASRRERQEFSEELCLRGGALRELRIGGLQKVEELKNYSRKTIWRTLQAKIKKSIYELILQLKSVN